MDENLETTIDHFSARAEELGDKYTVESLPDSYKELLDQFITMLDGKQVLDAGCGWGKDVQYFHEKGLDPVGIDLAEGMIRYATDHTDGTYQVADVRDLPFDDDRFAGIWCNTVMQFFQPATMQTVLRECLRVLEPGGVFYTTFKLGEGTQTRQHEAGDIERHMIPEDDAITMVESTGCTIIDRRYSEMHGMDVLHLFCRYER